MSNYDPAAFAKYAIYPNNWEASDAARARVEGHLIQFLRLLRDVVGRNAGLLIWRIQPLDGHLGVSETQAELEPSPEIVKGFG